MSTESKLDFDDLFSELDSVSYASNDTLVSNTGPLVDDFVNMDFDFKPELVAPPITTADDDLSKDADFWSSMNNSMFENLDLDLDLPINNAVVPSFDSFINYDAGESMTSSLK